MGIGSSYWNHESHPRPAAPANAGSSSHAELGVSGPAWLRSSLGMSMRPGKKAIIFFGSATAIVLFCILYVRARPLVFNESFFSHAHCIKSAGLGLETYAMDHNGRFPFHTNGYADALILAAKEGYCSASELTGAGYDSKAVQRAWKSGEHARENQFGRVYVQGLSRTDESKIALLFDKVPTPGGDHCHLLRRLWAPLGREIYTVGDGMHFIPESEWPAYSKMQIELLVAAGIPQQKAEQYYSQRDNK